MKLALLILSCSVATATAQSFTPFTWPVSNAGPYTLTANMRSNVVFFPNSLPASENAIETHKYHHHTRIWWDDGMTWIAFSSGATNEADGGLQSAMCWSTNAGMSWSYPPTQIVPSQSTFLGTNNIFPTRWTYPRNFQKYNGTNYLVCAVDQLDDYGGGAHERGVALLARALHMDGTVGALFRISSATVTNMDGKITPDYDANLGPPLMEYSKIYGCWGGSNPNRLASEWTGWIIVYTPEVMFFDEPNTVSADGSTTNLYRIWREAGGTMDQLHYVWQQMSTNGGLTWPADPVQTQVPNNPSETVVRRLSDGRTVLVGNALWYGVVGGGLTNRDPLYLAITEPNTTTITNVTALRQFVSPFPVYPGSNRSGGAQYPDLIQVSNYMYISYSVTKEGIGFSRVLIPGMADNNNDIIHPGNRIVSARVGNYRYATPEGLLITDDGNYIVTDDGERILLE